MNFFIKLRSLTFFLLFFSLLLQEFISKVIDIDSDVFLKSIDELVVLLMAFFLFFLYFENKSNIHLSLLKKVSKYLLIYMLLSFASSLWGYSTFLSATYQFALDVKFFIVLFFCILMSSNSVNYNTIFKIMSVVIMVNLPFVIFQLVSPTLYDSFFPEGNHKALFYSSTGDGFNRVSGVFWHPGTMATMCALTIGLIFTKKHYNLPLNFMEKTILVISAAQIIFTLSRGEIGALLVSLFMVKFLIRKDFVTSLLYFIFSLFFILLSLYIFNDFFEMIANELGLSSNATELAPRAQLLITSLDIMKDFFPFGSGFGTYGGQSSVIFDSPIYWMYGFSDFWWYEEGYYLKDTFWPKVLGESGLVASLSLFLFILRIISASRKNAVHHLDHQSCFAFFASIYLLIVSFSAPVYNTPLYTLIAFSLTGFVFSKRGTDQK